MNIYVPKDKREVIQRARKIFGGSFSSLVVILIERYVKSYENEEDEKNESVGNSNGNESIQ